MLGQIILYLLVIISKFMHGTIHAQVDKLTRVVFKYSNKTHELSSSTRAFLTHRSTAVHRSSLLASAATINIIRTYYKANGEGLHACVYSDMMIGHWMNPNILIIYLISQIGQSNCPIKTMSIFVKREILILLYQIFE